MSDSNFFKDCRNKGSGFYEIKNWSIGNDRIVLSLHITNSGREQLFLNRTKYGKHERGVEIPFSLAQEVGMWLFRQTSEDAYQKGDNHQSGKSGDYIFETIQKFEVNHNKAIALKLMYSFKETKYFLNIENKFSIYKFEPGVEIPRGFVEQIGIYLCKLKLGDKKIKNKKCVCGGKIYEYGKSGNAKNKIFELKVCFKCGKFTGESMADEVLTLLCDEPELLLHMIGSGYLVRR